MHNVENKIICGNSLEISKQIPAESVDAIVTSPPYFWLRDYGAEGQIGQEDGPEMYVENLLRVFREGMRILKSTGTFWLNIGDSFAGSKPMRTISSSRKGERLNQMKAKLKIPKTNIPEKSMICIPERVILSLIREGWILRNKLIWVKVPSMPTSVKDRFSTTYEFVYLFVKSKKYFFDLEAVKVPYSKYTIERIRSFIINREHFDPKRHKQGDGFCQHPFEILQNSVTSAIKKAKNANSNESDDKSLIDRLDFADLKKNPGDVWFLPTANFKGAHLAVFPEKLPELCIKAGCPLGGLVFDPFCGSGTTLAVSKRLGRRYLGIDLNPEYVRMSRKRVDAVQTDNKKE